MCRAIGEFKGGSLGYFADDDSAIELETLQANHEREAIYLDVKADFHVFNGNCAHFVEPFQGERLSFVFFSVSNYWKTKRDVLAELKERGFPLPTSEWMSHCERVLPFPRGYGCHRLPRMASLAEMFGQTPPRKIVKRLPSETLPKQKQPSVIALLLAAKSPSGKRRKRPASSSKVRGGRVSP